MLIVLIIIAVLLLGCFSRLTSIAKNQVASQTRTEAQTAVLIQAVNKLNKQIS